MNRRRIFLVALGAGALAAPFISFAQQQNKVWRVAFLSLRRIDSLDTDSYGTFLRGMRDLGYVEGRNLVIEWRSADGKAERLPTLAAELVQLKVDVIVAAGSPAISAAQKATATIPIVMGSTGDPVGSGFVQSLARPGGNITGRSNLTTDVGTKHLEMLLDLRPELSRLAFLHNPVNPSERTVSRNVQAAAQKAGIKFLSVEARTAPEIENAFAMLSRQKTGAVVVGGDALFVQQRSQIAKLALQSRLPSIGLYGEYVEAGGLMSYGPSIADNYRGAATYVDKILKGAKPAELPVEQPTKFELVINMKTAKALGIKIPNSILVRADRVIE